jgi:hypothetical protein
MLQQSADAKMSLVQEGVCMDALFILVGRVVMPPHLLLLELEWPLDSMLGMFCPVPGLHETLMMGTPPTMRAMINVRRNVGRHVRRSMKRCKMTSEVLRLVPNEDWCSYYFECSLDIYVLNTNICLGNSRAASWMGSVLEIFRILSLK